MKRRTFILTAAGATAAAAVCWEAFSASDEDIIAMVVRRKLDYLRLEPAGVRRFARDIAARHVISEFRMRVLSALTPLYTRLALSSEHNALAEKLRHGEDRIVGAYLIGSDFFINGADESREVKYLGMMDARRACGNPFARPPV